MTKYININFFIAGILFLMIFYLMSPYIESFTIPNKVSDTQPEVIKPEKYIGKLKQIHSELYNFKGNLMREIPEQIVAIKHIRPDDCVLELGCDVGTNSCVINSILSEKTNHLAVESNVDVIPKLKENRDNNNLKFQIGNFAISNKPLFQNHWETSESTNGKKVTSKTWDDVKTMFPKLNFNVIVSDCEGCFIRILKTFPAVLNNIRLIIIEHDFNSESDIQFFYELMKKKNYICASVYNKGTQYAPGILWNDGVKSDPVFVSAWIKQER